MNHRAASAPEHRAPEPGDTVRAAGVEYRVVGRLGRGGMAHVLDVEDRDLGKRFALKLLDPHLAADPESLERFEREARALARLDHPNIVTVMRLDRTDDERQPFFLMERLRGGTLRDHMNRGALSARRALTAAEHLARALHYVHERGLLHRDVKPSNVFLHVDAYGAEVVKLLDFGVMRLVHAESAPEDGFFGTAHYAAPEQLVLGRAQGPETDVYSAGLVLFEALTGRHPFEDAERSLRGARAVRARGAPALRESLPRGRLSDEALAEVGPLVASMLCKNPLGRPTAGVVARALARCLRRVPDERGPARDLGEDTPLRTRSPEPFSPAHLAAPTRLDAPPSSPAPDASSGAYDPVSDADLVGTLESPVLLLRPSTTPPVAVSSGSQARAGRTTPLRAVSSSPPGAAPVPVPVLRPFPPSLPIQTAPPPPQRIAPTAPARRAGSSGPPTRPPPTHGRAVHVALGALVLLWLVLAVGGVDALRRRGLLPAARPTGLATELVALATKSRALPPALAR